MSVSGTGATTGNDITVMCHKFQPLAATDSAVPAYTNEPRWDPTQQIKAYWESAGAFTSSMTWSASGTGNWAWTDCLGASSLAAAGLALAGALAF